MARSTCNPNAEVPKGMMKFEVIRSTIRDSIGQYCVPGDMAVLTPRHAKSYLNMNYIKVALPEGFADDDDEQDEANAILHEQGHADPKYRGRADLRRADVERRRQELDDEREKILADARAEAAAILAAAEDSTRSVTSAASGSGDEQSPTGGDAEPSSDAGTEDKTERSESEADTGGDNKKRRRRT